MGKVDAGVLIGNRVAGGEWQAGDKTENNRRSLVNGDGRGWGKLKAKFKLK